VMPGTFIQSDSSTADVGNQTFRIFPRKSNPGVIALPFIPD